MTKEEKAIDYLKYMRKINCEDYLLVCPKDTVAYKATLAEKEFYDTAIKALEQEPILDKVRAEIDSLEWWCNGEDYFVNRKAVNCILDKYKAEIEPQESEDT